MMEEEFWKSYKVEGEKGCWVWINGNNKSKGCGYGALKFNNKKCDAHRVAYTLKFGAIPKGMLVRHTCDNPPCINPDHLIIGTYADNSRDCVERNRHPRLRGEKHGGAKLNWKLVNKIRYDRNLGLSQYKLAAKYNISRRTIRDIIDFITWKPDPEVPSNG